MKTLETTEQICKKIDIALNLITDVRDNLDVDASDGENQACMCLSDAIREIERAREYIEKNKVTFEYFTFVKK